MTTSSRATRRTSFRNVSLFVQREVPVEVAGQDSVEGAVSHGEAQRVADDGQSATEPGPSYRHHSRGFVDADDRARDMPGQKAGSAGNVEGACAWQAVQELDDLVDFDLPTGPGTFREEALARVPVVVLPGPPIVVVASGAICGETGLRHWLKLRAEHWSG